MLTRKYEIIYFASLLPVFRLTGIAVANRVTINSPSLSPRPCRFVGISLRSLSAAYSTRFRIIVYYMITTAIGTEIIFKRLIGMADCYIIIGGIARQTGSLEKKQVVYVPYDDWTSGFFPGSMWYMYQLTGDEKWEKLAVKYTEALDSVQYLTWHHDVGFMVGCSYLNGIRMGHKDYASVVLQTARSLSTRFRPEAGVIQSWDADRGWQAQRGWKCPVIIDNRWNRPTNG